MGDTEMTFGLDDVVDLFTPYEGWWAIGGGWAIDLHLGARGRRPHKDVDLICLQPESDLVRRHLAGWDLHRLIDGEPEPWVGDLAPSHQVWARPSPADDWAFEILFEAIDDHRWRFRRNPQVTLPFEDLVTTLDGIPTVHLGVALIYKAKRDADLDLEDLLASLTGLGVEGRQWLSNATRLTHGVEHRWVQVLDGAGPESPT